MNQNAGFVGRGLLLLGVMVIVAVFVSLLVFRPFETAPEVPAGISQRSVSKDGWLVRYNATVALARRGSSKLPCDVLAEMLDEEQQLRNFQRKTKDGKDVIDEYGARKTVLNGLQALTVWLKHKDAVNTVGADNPDLQRVYAAVDKLTQSDSPTLKKEADSIKKKVGER